jgi:hypothetical protein
VGHRMGLLVFYIATEPSSTQCYFWQRLGKSGGSDMTDMNGDRGSKGSFDVKRWPLNLFCS